MSNDARDLANQINQREENRRKQQEYQIYRAKVMKAKAPEFWRQIINAIERARDGFNETLAASGNSKYAIEYIGPNTSGPAFTHKVIRGDRPSVSLTIRFEPEALVLTVEGVRTSYDTTPEGKPVPRKMWSLQIDTDDNICIMGNDRKLSPDEVAVEVVRYFVP